MKEPRGTLYLGETVDPDTHERTGDAVHYPADRLTTHGVIVGMTGSGKTGLGVVLLEEALLEGIPCLVLDPKGDMANLLLSFPDLEPADFAPWVNEGDARRKGLSTDEYASQVADTWRSGLASWGMDADRIRELRERVEFTVYTPGSTAGVPLDLLGGLTAAPDADVETVRDEIEGTVTGLLGLVGVEADPLTSREHILLSNLLEHAWQNREELDLPGLVARVHKPPLRKLGVFDLDTFFPEADRLSLAMRLNGLIASPSFDVWTRGPALDPAHLLADSGGRTPAAIVSLAHLSEEERQFVVALLLTRLISWMRSQSGTTDLRALVYMDEVFGYVPPTAMPPAKKPILTILKQARAFGVGMVLSTQNPVDLDYKAISNAGTWMIGRLQTERDKARLVDGLRSASGADAVDALLETISGLGKREFVLHSTKADAPIVFGTRWAMSYLRGPLARDQIARLMRTRTAEDADPEPGAAAAEGNSTPTATDGAPDESPVMPDVADDVPVFYLDPAASWADRLRATAGGPRLEPALVARVQMLYDEARADLRHEEEWETVFYPLAPDLEPGKGMVVDYDARDLRPEPPEGVRYALTDAPLDRKSWFNGIRSDLRDHLHRSRTLEVWHNPTLKLFSRVGESRDAFLDRCRDAAEEREDQEAAKLRHRFEQRLARLQVQVNKAEDRVEELEEDTRSRRQQEIVSGVGSLIGVFLGGKSRTRGLATKIGRLSSRRRHDRADGAASGVRPESAG